MPACHYFVLCGVACTHRDHLPLPMAVQFARLSGKMKPFGKKYPKPSCYLLFDIRWLTFWNLPRDRNEQQEGVYLQDAQQPCLWPEAAGDSQAADLRSASHVARTEAGRARAPLVPDGASEASTRSHLVKRKPSCDPHAHDVY